MRRPLRRVALLFVAAVACTPAGSTDPAPQGPPTPVVPAPPPTSAPVAAARAPEAPPPPRFPCGPARNLASGEQLLAALTAEWPRPGVGLSPVTVDLIADVDLAASSDRLPLPAYCGARCTHRPRKIDCEGAGDPCRAPVRFRVNDAVPGVTVDGKTFAQEGTALKIEAGARFRLIQRVHEYHPEAPYYDPVVQVAPACDVPCTEQQRRCDSTGLCAPTEGDSQCLMCDGLGRSECACRTAEGQQKPDGAECTYLSGDYFPTGACAGGRCVVSH